MTRIKICGLTRKEDIAYANALHPDYIGFVFYEKSKRYVTKERAAALKRQLDSSIGAVGVFVDAPSRQVIELLNENVIDMAQLHGNETEEEIGLIQEATGKPVIRAVQVKDISDVKRHLSSRADFLLFDSGMGSGETFDWQMLRDISQSFFLAGGLNDRNIETAIRNIQPFAVDLSSGVETDGVKDFHKMETVIQLCHGN